MLCRNMNFLSKTLKTITLKNDRVSINIAGCKMCKSDNEKLLCVKFDEKLTFDDHISGICKTAGSNLV